MMLDREWLASSPSGEDELSKLSSERKAEFVKAAHQQADAILVEGEAEAAEERQIWSKKWETVHGRAVRKVQRYPEWAAELPNSCRRHPGAGEIAGLYTFGGPGT